MKNLTEKEKLLLKAFALTEYGNGTGKDVVWMFSIQDHSTLEGKTFSGVCSSLTEKGLIGSDTVGDKGHVGVKIKDTYTMWLTEEGIQVFEELLKQEPVS